MKFHPDVLAAHTEVGGLVERLRGIPVKWIDLRLGEEAADAIEALYAALASERAAHAETNKLLAGVRDDAMRADNELCAMEARIADLEAENERLREQITKATDPTYLEEKLRQIGVIDEMATEALSRTGAVKVNALEWEKCQPGVYISSSHSAKTEIGEYLAQSRAVYFRGNLIALASGLDAAKAAAQADYERRILSTLTTEPAAPEGRQEHEHIEVTDAGLIQFTEWFRKNYPGPDTIIHKPDWHAPKIYRAALHAAGLSCPAERAVTDAMELARAVLAQSITAGHNVPGPTPKDIENAFWALDAALKAAMEAGR